MPLRFHSERKSVNTQSSISRDQAYTGLAPILLTRYKKILMPTYLLKMHLESLVRFDLSTHTALCQPFTPIDVRAKQIFDQFNTSVTRRPESIRRTKFNSSTQPTQRCSTRSSSTRPSINPPQLLNFVNYVFLSPISCQVLIIHIMTPLWFSIIFCYQIALINTTFLLPLIIISTHQASSYGQRR